MQQNNLQNYGNQYQYTYDCQTNQYVPQQFVVYGQQLNYQTQPQYVVTPQYQYQAQQNVDQYQPPFQNVQVNYVTPSLNNTSAQSINSEPKYQADQSQTEIDANDYQQDQLEYAIHPAIRLFYILKLIVALYFVIFVVFNTIGKYNNEFQVLYDSKQSINSYNVTETTYTYYLARDELYKYDCKPLDFKFYGEIMKSSFQQYFLIILGMLLIWKVYYIYFQFVEIRRCTFGGNITYQFRNQIRIRDCFNFILDYTSSIAISPFTAFIFSQVNCSSWKYGEQNVIAYPVFYYFNSLIWFIAAFISIAVLIFKTQEGYNLRPFGIFMIVPFITHRIFSTCTHMEIPTVVYKVTVYSYYGNKIDSYYEEDRSYLLNCLCKAIGLLGQYVLPIYQIIGMILQLPYMIYYTPIYLIVYYCVLIVISLITIKAHSRIGY
ncbi:hypothetical protein ABPG74_007255 [Tetrahymena malaccensis]